MKANFDNMRKAATASMNELGKVLKEEILIVTCSYYLDAVLKEKIVIAFNEAACQIDLLNCLYDDNVEDDLNDLSDVIDVERLDIEDDEENTDDDE